MNLSNLNFQYKIKDKKFPFISYEFNILPDVESKEELIELAKSSLQDLERILDNKYTRKGFKKEEDGEVTSSKIELGYNYSNSSLISIFRKGLNLTQLRYVILINSKGEPRDLTLSLTNSDSNSARLLDVYDSVIMLPKLEISEDAQLQVDRINSLRSERFDVKEYLSLPHSN